METTTLILDLDGVLITTPSWKSDEIHSDGYSEFNKKCVEKLNELLLINNFDIWLSSTRRTKKTLKEFNKIFSKRNIKNEIIGFLPSYQEAKNRKEEVQMFISENNLTNFLIIDDDKSLNGLTNDLKLNLVLTDYMRGFNQEKYLQAVNLLSRNSKYKLERTCKECGNIDKIKVTKLQCAFELYDSSKIWKTPCSKCQSIECSSLQHCHPELNMEILTIWGNNENLYIMSQDEEIILAEMKYLPMILKAIDEGSFLERKNNILIESICVLLYDNTASSDEYSEKENIGRAKNADKIRPELIKRKNKIEKASTTIMEYIQEVVFPQIEIKIKRA